MHNTSNGNRGNLVTKALHTDATNKELVTSAKDIIACLYARGDTTALVNVALNIEGHLSDTDDEIEVDLNPGSPSVFSTDHIEALSVENDETKDAGPSSDISEGVSCDEDEVVENGRDSVRFVGPLYTAKELQIATTQTFVSLMMRPGVSDEVRLKAALAVHGESFEFATATAPEVK